MQRQWHVNSRLTRSVCSCIYSSCCTRVWICALTNKAGIEGTGHIPSGNATLHFLRRTSQFATSCVGRRNLRLPATRRAFVTRQDSHVLSIESSGTMRRSRVADEPGIHALGLHCSNFNFFPAVREQEARVAEARAASMRQQAAHSRQQLDFTLLVKLRRKGVPQGKIDLLLPLPTHLPSPVALFVDPGFSFLTKRTCSPFVHSLQKISK